MTVIESTDSVQRADRFDFWRRIFSERFNIDCAIEADPASFQQRLSFRQLGALSILEQEGSPFTASLRGSEKDCLVIVVIPREGEGTLRLGGSTIPLKVGSFCAFHSCEATRLDWESDCRHLILTYPSVHLDDRCPEWRCDTPLVLPATEGVGTLFVELAQALSPQGDLSESCHQEAIDFALALLSTAVKSQERTTEVSPTHMRSYHKKRIRDIALLRLRDADLDVPRIAAAAGLSVAHVHHLFADEPLSLMHWIYEERLNRCHRDLANPEMSRRSISGIAYAWGFNSPSHFCRAFQKRFGITASALRAQAKSSSGKLSVKEYATPRQDDPDDHR